MRLTSKGQVTIPQEIREAIGLLPYTEVEFEIDGDAVKVRRARHSKAARPYAGGSHARACQRKMTTDQILALTRG